MTWWAWALAGLAGVAVLVMAGCWWGSRNAPTAEEVRAEYEAWLGAEGYKDSGGLD